jgi:hypothetical protein
MPDKRNPAASPGRDPAFAGIDVFVCPLPALPRVWGPATTPAKHDRNAL